MFGLTRVHDHGSTGDRDAAVDGPGRSDGAVDSVVADAYVQKNCVQLGYTILIGASHYRGSGSTLASWTDAETDCEDDAAPANLFHTHLVVLSSDVEASGVYTNVIGSAGEFWIGLSDRVVSNNFKWVTNETTGYPPNNSGPPWVTGEPSGGAGEDCVRENTTVNMLDTVCATPHLYACECDMYAPNHASF